MRPGGPGEVLLRARLALGDRAETEDPLHELRSIATAVDTEAMRGSGRFADGLVAAAAGDHKGAKGHFEDAVYLFDRSGAPLETASARLELARCLFALGQPEAAELQAQDARESFQILGAAAEAERAAACCASWRLAMRHSTWSVSRGERWRFCAWSRRA